MRRGMLPLNGTPQKENRLACSGSKRAPRAKTCAVHLVPRAGTGSVHVSGCGRCRRRAKQYTPSVSENVWKKQVCAKRPCFRGVAVLF